MSDKPQVHRNHNVYILGAGFSRDAGLPLMWDFLNQMRDSIDWLASQQRDAEREAVERVFEFRRRAAGAAYRTKINVENIEELFSLASAHEKAKENDYISLAIAATLDYAKSKNNTAKYKVEVADYDIFAEGSVDWHNETRPGEKFPFLYDLPVYDFYADIISGRFSDNEFGGRNTVLTFNYDTLLEDAFHRRLIPYTYPSPFDKNHDERNFSYNSTLKPIPILKLHGSVNWAYSSTRNLTAQRAGASQAMLANNYESYSDLLSANEQPFLVPPTWKKFFGTGLAQVWEDAVKAISEATRIIIIGFSMPPTDIHFRYLLAAGLQENISLRDFIVVNYTRDEKTAAALQNNFGQIFQPILSDNIRWYWQGAQQYFANFSELFYIGRGVNTEKFGKITPR